jgi:N-acetylneuraminic acid mutarotase
MKILRNKNLLFVAALCLLSSGYLLSQDFTWIKGSTLADQPGAYGSTGVSAPVNNPGGRSYPARWKDSNGNFWVFGGYGLDYIGNSGYLGDLWKYNPGNNQWTWMKGDNLIAQGGVYGTLGVAAPTNKPGARGSSAYWTDASGNFWMFGGYGYDIGSTLGQLSDLWKYNTTTGQWTWIAGPNVANQNGQYGTISVPSSTNIPGARYGTCCWTDLNGDLWLFGGFGTNNNQNYGTLNDLWRYNIGNNQWTWMKGGMTVDQNGTYGTLGTPASSTTPGTRVTGQFWSDNTGSLWMFGGKGYDAMTPLASYLSDLWKYDVISNQWTWVKGSSTINQNAAYGSPGQFAATNIPGARLGGISWVDANNTAWMFGGEGFPGSGTTVGELNDLWRYNISSNQFCWTKGSAVLDQPGTYGTQGFPAQGNRPGGRHGAAPFMDGNSNLWIFGGQGVASTGPEGQLNDLWKYTNCFIAPVTMTIVSLDSSICAGESTSLTATGSNNYLWPHNNATTPYTVISPSATTTFSVHTSDANGCVYTATFTEIVSACDAVGKVLPWDKKLAVYPDPSNGSFVIDHDTPGAVFTIYNSSGQLLRQEELEGKTSVLQTNLPPGIYYFEISLGRNKRSGKFVIAP